MQNLIGFFRAALVVTEVALGMILTLLLSLVPVRIRGVRIAAWIPVWMSRIALWICGIRVASPDTPLLWRHKGLVFPNHLSYADIVVLMAAMPFRFLSNHGVRRIPFIGWTAMAIGTVFVNRRNVKSRADARNDVLEQLIHQPFPPLIIFPEGKIYNGEYGQLHSFVPGAFRIAQEAQLPVIPLLIRYNHPEVMRWYSDSESMYTAAWRLLRHTGDALTATLHLLPARIVSPEETATASAQTTQLEMEKALQA